MGLFGKSKSKEEKAEEIINKLKPGTHKTILKKISDVSQIMEYASIAMTPSQLAFFLDENNYPITYCEGYGYDSFTDPLIGDLTRGLKLDWEYNVPPTDYQEENIHFGEGEYSVVIDYCGFNLFLLKALMKYTQKHLAGVLEMIEEYPCTIFKGIDKSSAEKLADVLTRIGAEVHVEGIEGTEDTNALYSLSLNKKGSNSLLLAQGLMKNLNLKLKEAKELIDSIPCVILRDTDKSKLEKIAIKLEDAGAECSIEAPEKDNGFDQLLQNLLSAKKNEDSNKIQVDVNDERFYEAVEEDASIIYAWNIRDLKEKDLKCLEQASLEDKTLREAALSLGLDINWENEEAESTIFNAEPDEEEDGTFSIMMKLPGTLRKHYPFMAALYAKYPYADIQYAAFQHNINSCNAFGGPWSGGVKRREMTEEHQYLIYYLSEDVNSFTVLPSQHEKDIKEWMDENVEGLINYKVVPLHEAKIANIDWDKEMEYFSYSKNDPKVQASVSKEEAAPIENPVETVSKLEEEEESYFSERLEKLIASAISDGVLTDKEKEIILRRAEKEGEDEDEVMMIIESRLKKLRK